MRITFDSAINIINLKHDGSSDNLHTLVLFCNRAKGSDVGSVSTSSEFTRFFNPRPDHDHFVVDFGGLHGVLLPNPSEVKF